MRSPLSRGDLIPWFWDLVCRGCFALGNKYKKKKEEGYCEFQRICSNSVLKQFSSDLNEVGTDRLYFMVYHLDIMCIVHRIQ